MKDGYATFNIEAKSCWKPFVIVVVVVAIAVIAMVDDARSVEMLRSFGIHDTRMNRPETTVDWMGDGTGRSTQQPISCPEHIS